MTPLEQRRIRLKNEYEKICQMPRSNLITITPTPGQTVPYVNSYIVCYNLPTFIDSNARVQNSTTVRVDLPESFPEGQPVAHVIEGRVPYHVNWWADGNLCNGNFWNRDRWVWEYILFAAEVVIFEPSRVNIKSPANPGAIPFYQNNSRRFPTFNTKEHPLPHPRERRRMTILG